jgi:hypothetical protein
LTFQTDHKAYMPDYPCIVAARGSFCVIDLWLDGLCRWLGQVLHSAMYERGYFIVWEQECYVICWEVGVSRWIDKHSLSAISIASSSICSSPVS